VSVRFASLIALQICENQVKQSSVCEVSEQGNFSGKCAEAREALKILVEQEKTLKIYNRSTSGGQQFVGEQLTCGEQCLCDS